MRSTTQVRRASRSRKPQPLVSLAIAARLLRAPVKALETLRDQGRMTIYRLHGTRKRLVESRQVLSLRRHPRVVARARRASA